MRGLYAVTPNWDDTEKLLSVTESIIKGGASMVQYRHKEASAQQRFTQASALQALGRAHQVPFIINDDVDLCIALDTDGVHLGGTDAPIREVRQRLGAHKIIGASCYGSIELARAAAADGASYVAFGGFYPSLVKQYEVSTPTSIVAQAKHELNLPIVVIGGMTAENCLIFITQGIDMVAAISSIYLNDNPRSTAQAFNCLFSLNLL